MERLGLVMKIEIHGNAYTFRQGSTVVMADLYQTDDGRWYFSSFYGLPLETRYFTKKRLAVLDLKSQIGRQTEGSRDFSIWNNEENGPDFIAVSKLSGSERWCSFIGGYSQYDYYQVTEGLEKGKIFAVYGDEWAGDYLSSLNQMLKLTVDGGTIGDYPNKDDQSPLGHVPYIYGLMCVITHNRMKEYISDY
jgi:hypothetical protein